jgi:hypothetical protein
MIYLPYETESKFQQQVFDLSKNLPALSEKQADWVYRHCFRHIAKRTVKGSISYLDCGHQWESKDAYFHIFLSYNFHHIKLVRTGCAYA